MTLIFIFHYMSCLKFISIQNIKYEFIFSDGELTSNTISFLVYISSHLYEMPFIKYIPTFIGIRLWTDQFSSIELPF